ncbi:MAG: HD domain-containing protein [Crocinitomicaceae bacterium]|nr:HD domain-containing protein [Crocinitomicaceae bacterium]
MTLVEKVTAFVRPKFEGEGTGHDFHHIERVLNLSRYIQAHEGGDIEIVELSALLHDISDHKFNGGKLDEGGKVAFNILIEYGASIEIAERVKYIVDNISYKGANVPAEMRSIEGRIVQDADRLDAMGAIGIARTFAYGGNRNQPIYEPTLSYNLHGNFEEYANSKTSTINHFYEKLLLLKNRLNTKTGRKIGQERHDFMELFLNQFYSEWKFNSIMNK